MSNHFIINTLSRSDQLLKSEIWNSSKPFGLGYPFNFVLERTKDGIRVRNLNEVTVENIPENQLLNQEHSLSNNIKIRIYPVRSGEISLNWKSNYIEPQDVVDLEEIKTFRKSVLSSFVGLCVLISIAMITSHFFHSKDEAIIPPQFAKFILTPQVSQGLTENKESAQEQEGASKKAGSLIRAFQSTVVQKSTQKLLKGGVLALLAKSDLLSDRNSKAALSAMFDQGQKSRTLTPVAGLLSSNPIVVGALGGGAGAGNSVGYGKGERVSLKGQGESFVSLSTQDAKVEDGLSKDEVGRVIHSHLAEVRYCYESAMIKNPSVQGKLVVDFIIQGGGNVKSGKINSSTVGDASLDQCILSHLFKWKFPKPTGGVDVAIVYPFIFKALGR